MRVLTKRMRASIRDGGRHMSNLVELWEKPAATEMYMIIGWRQWADAGSISSLLPQYLIEQTNAKKIGEIKPKGFYLFQIPGTHHLLRPEIQLEEGYPKGLTTKKNEIFYSGNDEKGLLIFLGDEPHLNADEYGEALFYIVKELGVKRVVIRYEDRSNRLKPRLQPLARTLQ